MMIGILMMILLYKFLKNQWYHVALTFANFDPILITLWLNGIKVEEKLQLDPTDWYSDFSVGYTDYNINHLQDFGSKSKFNGLISALKISNEVLYDEPFELNTNFSSDESTYLLWDFNESAVRESPCTAAETQRSQK